MADLIDRLKSQARILHRQVQTREPSALARMRKLPEQREADDPSLAANIRRRHCLAVLAKELGFQGWPHALSVLSGASTEDFGTLLYPKGAFAHSNIWSASYEEARSIREETGGYLLAYKNQFFVTDRHFIETLGLDPEDPDWEEIRRDWARPANPEARTRLYEKLLRQQA